MKRQKWALVLCVLAGIFSGVLAGIYFLLVHDLPEINALKQYKPSSAAIIYSADKKILTRFYIEKRFPVSIDQMPQSLIKAIILTEDKAFFEHSGINFKAIVRAVLQDIKARRFKQGASTLTQQLAKTLFLTSEKSVIRKIKEALLAFQIERRYTKNEILELYLNQIYLGSGAYGVEAACQTYFNCSVDQISIAQAAMLAGLPKAPSIYSPLRNPEKAKERRQIILNLLFKDGFITEAQKIKAANEPAALISTDVKQNFNSYFSDYIRQILNDRIGYKNLYSRGVSVYTTLDPDLQNKAAQAVLSRMNELKQRMEKEQITQVQPEYAVIAIQVKTGAILAMIGGTDYQTSRFNRAVHAKRQPGSAFKPIIFAAAIKAGACQRDLLLDAPLSYTLADGEKWVIQNFSKSYSGKMTYRKALALSKNTPAVRLLDSISPERAIGFARTLGINSLLEPNLSLALGTSEISLMELTGAYIPFANKGIRVEPYGIEKIVDPEGRVIYSHQPLQQSVMSPKDAAVTADMLKAVIREGTGRKAARIIKKEIAGKTGTTDNYKDALFIGFSPDMALGVWVGRDDAGTLGRLETGARAALPVWIDVMQYHLSDRKWEYFNIPDGTKLVYMNPDTGHIQNDIGPGMVKTLIKVRDHQ